MAISEEHLPQARDGIPLIGLDGANPLGVLAAMGVLRLLSIDNYLVTMSWRLSSGTWHPVVFGTESKTEQLGARLHAAAANLDKSTWSLDKKLPFAAERLKAAARDAINSSSPKRFVADEIASLGVEFFREDDGGDFKGTSFCMVRSGDSTGQGLLAYGKRILETTTPEQLQRAITSDWTSGDEQCALRWDPSEDRGYALQWRNPSKVGAMSTKAANCLALLGMPMFPMIPTKTKGVTVGFGLREAKQSSFTWPIWKYPISAEIAKSLLAASVLQSERPPLHALGLSGIAAVYRCNRIMTSTYYANFSPSCRVG